MPAGKKTTPLVPAPQTPEALRLSAADIVSLLGGLPQSRIGRLVAAGKISAPDAKRKFAVTVLFELGLLEARNEIDRLENLLKKSEADLASFDGELKPAEKNWEAQAALAKVRGDTEMVKLAKEQGILVKIEDVRVAVTTALSLMAAELRGLPSAMVEIDKAEKTPARIKASAEARIEQIIKRMFDAANAGLADEE